MKFQQKSLIYILCTLTLFVLYIYMQIMREYAYYDSFFTQEQLSECVRVCTAEKHLVFDARILINPEIVEQRQKITYREIEVLLEEGENVEVGDKIRVFGTLERRLIDGKFSKYRLINTSFIYIDEISKNNPFSIFYYLHRLSKLSLDMQNRIIMLFGLRYGDLVAGILFGMQPSLSDSFYDALINTGTVHIIAASGYNITLLTEFCLLLLLRLMKRKWAIAITSGVVLAYTFISGLGEPIIRAALMSLLVFGASASGRSYHALWSLMLSVFLMLLYNPLYITHVSFLLSVSATGGILLFSKGISFFFSRQFSNFTFAMYFVPDFSTTLSATIVTFPILLIYFGRFSIISLIVNVLVLWCIPPMMLFSSFALLFSSFSTNLAYVAVLLCKPFLEYFMRIIFWFGSFNDGIFVIDSTSWWFGFGYYLFCISVYFYLLKKHDV